MTAVSYVGYLNEASGLGSAARKHLVALSGAGAEVYARPVGLTPEGPQQLPLDRRSYPELEDMRTVDERMPDVEIIHTMPTTVPELLTAGRTTVASTVWETDVFPAGWSAALRDVAEVWVPSRFVADGVRAVVDAPVEVIPHPVRVTDTPPARESLPGIPDDVFLFAAILEWQERKNPLALIDAFNMAFAGRRDVALLVRIGNLFFRDQVAIGATLERRTRTLWPGTGPKIYVVNEILSDTAIQSIYARCDAFVSLHRSEGFGLCLAEAMAMSRPVVATAYGGCMDFMDDESAFTVDYELVPVRESWGMTRGFDSSMHWASARLDAAVDAMRSCVADAGRRDRIAQRGHARVSTYLNPTRVGDTMRQRLEEIAP